VHHSPVAQLHLEAHPGPYPPGAQPVDAWWSRAAWLPVLGPSAWVLWAEMASIATDGPTVIDYEDLAGRVGLQVRRLRYPLERLEQFRLVDQPRPDCFRVKTSAGPLGRRTLRRHPRGEVADGQAQLFGDDVDPAARTA